MVLSYARGSWRFQGGKLGGKVRWRWQLDMAMWVAVSVAMKSWWQVWWQNVMAKMRATVFGWQRGWQFCMAKIEAGNLAISFFGGSRDVKIWWQFSGQKTAKHLAWREQALGVHGCTWHMLTEGAWETFWRQMVWEVDGKSGWQNFGQHQLERDVDTNHSSLIAPSRGATPTEPMNQTRTPRKKW